MVEMAGAAIVRHQMIRVRRVAGVVATTIAVTLAAGVPPAVAAPAAPAAATATTAVVTLVHGVRGLVADIYLDGALVLPTFQPERFTDPITIAAGRHVVDVRQAGAAASTAPLLNATISLDAGSQSSAVVHLDAKGDPTITVYADDLKALPAGRSSLVVRHAAQADPVAVSLDQQLIVPVLASGAESGYLATAADHRITVTAAAGGGPVVAPQALSFADGSVNFLYLIGSERNATLGWAAVTRSGVAAAPTAVQTGDGSMAQRATASSLRSMVTNALPIAGAVALVGYLGLTVMPRRRRRTL